MIIMGVLNHEPVDMILERFVDYDERQRSRKGISKWFYNIAEKVNEASVYTLITLFALPVYISERVYDAYDEGKIFSSLENRLLLDKTMEKIADMPLMGIYLLTPSLRDNF